jgi:hypothetical protein
MNARKIMLATAVTGFIATGGTAFADTSTAHVDDCSTLSGGPTGFPTGCQFNFFDGNSNPAVVEVGKFKDTTSNAGNEAEVFTGTGLANDTGTTVTLSPANNPNGPSQTCYSFVSTKATLNWAMTIQPGGSWNLTCNFQKKS